MEKFVKLGLSKEILKAIEEAKFTNPSEIQEKAIPYVLQGKDVLGSASTGSGKTLAFGAGIIDNTDRNVKGVKALIMTPTRELAEQVSFNLKKFAKHSKLNITEVYGGVSIGPQIDALRHADVVVGTPGRILDHMERKTFDLKNIKFLVLDEADRMLDMGFIDDVEKIIRSCPKERQTLLFSATVSPDIQVLSKRYMKDPVFVEVESYVDPSKLTQVYYDVPPMLKFSLLVHLLKNEEGGLVMVFCNTRRNADMIARNLKRYEVNAMAIHGGLSQNKRNFVISHFHKQETFVLVCTDVAARGLDIKNVSHVYNYDIPKNSTEYIHRIGRTARAGKSGKAISIVSSYDYKNFREVCSDDSLDIKLEEMPKIEPLNIKFNADSGERHFGSRRFGGRSSGGERRFGSERREQGRGNFGGRRSFGRRPDRSEGRSGGERRFGSRDSGRRHDSRPRSSGRSFGRRF